MKIEGLYLGPSHFSFHDVLNLNSAVAVAGPPSASLPPDPLAGTVPTPPVQPPRPFGLLSFSFTRVSQAA